MFHGVFRYNQSSPWALASAFTWLMSHFFGGMSVQSLEFQSLQATYFSHLTLQSPTYYKHLQNGFQHLSIHFAKIFYTLGIQQET